MTVALRAEGLSKQYQLGATRERYKTLRESVTETATAPFRALRSTFSRGNGGRNKRGATSLWALKDVSLEIQEGDVVGVIGRNGAGKSTLLKILSKITEPTSGFAEVHGRVGSLLEVGTGFHNELTGRENIFLNGAILGMRRSEIHRKFDEIVAFAEVEQFIDTPVKRYSSGMYLRLAFAVAAHLEPEILLVDEVLAVGDASFQKKCLGKLGDVAKQGRTVLFVSHNMGAIRSMCTQGIVLDRGMVKEAGEIGKTIECYYRLIGALEQDSAAIADDGVIRSGFGPVKVDCEGSATVAQSKGFEAFTTFRFAEHASGFDLYCMLEDMYGREVFQLRESNTDLDVLGVGAGTYSIRTQFPPLWLSPGLYALSYKVQISGTFGSTRYVTDKVPIDVEGTSGAMSTSLLHPGVVWDIGRPQAARQLEVRGA
ncbi:MAG: polysaccharide ABC transporter ATP-binding protein [Acidobacteriota bacterium]